jgi:hypothetical protein
LVLGRAAAGAGTRVLASAANRFDRIRKLHGRGATTDVYVRSPLNDESTFWFVGKVARMMDVGDGDRGGSSSSMLAGSVYPTESEAILGQKRLILEYAKGELRPQNMGGPYSAGLEIWTAPGDSEMDVVRNKVALVRVAGSTRDLRDGFDANDVGYNPEVRCISVVLAREGTPVPHSHRKTPPRRHRIVEILMSAPPCFESPSSLRIFGIPWTRIQIYVGEEKEKGGERGCSCCFMLFLLLFFVFAGRIGFRESNIYIIKIATFCDVTGLRVVRDSEGRPVKPIFDVTV